jgi:hypothetical protein
MPVRNMMIRKDLNARIDRLAMILKDRPDSGEPSTDLLTKMLRRDGETIGEILSDRYPELRQNLELMNRLVERYVSNLEDVMRSRGYSIPVTTSRMSFPSVLLGAGIGVIGSKIIT